MDHNVNSSKNLVYTDLQTCSLPCGQNKFTENISSTDSSEIHLLREFLPHDGLCDFQSTTVDINPNPSDIILQRVEDECNGLPRDTFISNLIKLCNNDTESLEQLRLQYFIITKKKMDFPFPSAVLKKRIHPKTKTGEPLINKLGRDCFLLRLASKGEYSDDLKDVFNLKSSARNNSCVDSEVVTSTPHTCSDYSVLETLIKIESSMLEMKVNYEKEQSVLNDKIDNLYKTNEKLDYNFNKQKERLNNVQTQLNSTRNANTKLNETITSLEKQIKELLTHQSELKRGHIEQKNMKRTTDSTFNEIKESVKHNANLIEKCKKKSDSTSLLAYDLKMRLDSEASRITNITDSRATGICSLKTRVQVIGECVKDMESTVEEIPSKVKSCLASITEIRKRVNAIEKNCNQINTPATKSYAMAISEVPRKENTVLSGEPPPQLVKSTQSSLSNPNFIFDNPTSIIAPTKNIETVTNHTDHYIKNISETNTFNETSDTRTTIPAYFPRSMCNPTSIDFKGVVKKTRRISRFYIGGIDKSCSSEESMRKFLLDRNIHVTFLRYFYRPSRGTAAAQLNVNMDDEHLLKQPNFWPEGIFMKPWLPWEQFINEHSIEQKHGRY